MDKNLIFHFSCILAGFVQRQRDGCSRCCGILQSPQSNHLDNQRRECAEEHTVASGNNAEERAGHQDARRDADRQREHQ